MLTAEDLMTKTDLAVFEDMPITQLTKLMRQKRVGGLPVMNQQKKICGMVTVKGVFNAIGMARGMFLRKKRWFSLFRAGRKMIHVKEIYSRKIISVEPDTPIERVVEIMLDEDVHTLIVSDKENKTVYGVIGRHDVTWALFAPADSKPKDYRLSSRSSS